MYYKTHPQILLYDKQKLIVVIEENLPVNSQNCANLQNQSSILKCALLSLLFYFLYFKNFQKTVLSDIDSDRMGTWPVQLSRLRTSEMNCNNWSLISFMAAIVCLCQWQQGLELMIRKPPVLCFYFSEACLNTGLFLHFSFVCLFVVFGFKHSFLNKKAPRKQNVLLCKTYKDSKFTPKWGKE